MGCEANHGDFIGDLCIALAHRWEPERLFMILTGYCDESGTHAGSPLAVMSGLVASARQWRSYEKRTKKLFARYRVTAFHSTDVRRGSGDFDGWTIDKKIKFLDEFGTIINETAELMFNAVMLRDDYQYYCKLDWPKGRKDSE